VSDAATALHHPAVEPAESPLTPESWGKLGMWIFLAGDAMGFGTLLASYGAMRAGSADWPNPAEVLGIQLTALMTFLLICSSVTMVKALENLKNANLPRAKMFLLLTALGGAIFVGLQAYEWTHLIQRGLMVFGNPWGATLFGASFFIITGFHGMHVTAGVIYLLSIYGVVSRTPNIQYNYMVTEIAGLYWHFVDLVWIMVFTFVYLL
jgi:cytochrome c oxidase subunit 3